VQPPPSFVTVALAVPVTILVISTLDVRTQQSCWLKADALSNMYLYADTQHTEEKREGGRTLRQVTVHGSSEWVRC